MKTRLEIRAGRAVVFYRKYREMTVEGLAAKVQKSESYIKLIESGIRGIPEKNMPELLDVLGITADQFNSVRDLKIRDTNSLEKRMNNLTEERLEEYYVLLIGLPD